MSGPNPSGLCMCGCGLPAPLARRTDRKRCRIKGLPMRFIKGHNATKPVLVADPNPSGLCRCGCGRRTNLVPNNDADRGVWRGHHRLFAAGHAGRINGGKLAPWSVFSFDGDKRRWYVRCRDGRRCLWYRVVAWNLLGRELRDSEVVHHINGDSTDDRAENLAILTPSAHSQLHAAQRKAAA